MNRRPWPIVLMAILQFLSPFIYVGIAALFYQLSFDATMKEILALAPDLRKFEIFVLPLLLAGLILLVRKWGFYLVIIGSVYSIVRGIMEYVASNETDPVFPLIITNLFCIVLIATLLRPMTRSVYFNPRLRWWETSPRYLVNIASSLTRIGGKPMKSTLQNIASGGAGVETEDTDFLKDEVLSLEFQYAGEVYKLKSRIIWAKPLTGGKQYFGLQWDDDNSNAEWSKLRRLIRSLKTKGTRTTRKSQPILADVKEWLGKLAG